MTTVMENSSEVLLQSINELDPLIRAHMQNAEVERRLSEPVSEALKDAGFFRMFRPITHGGFGLKPVEEFKIAEALARIDSSAAWNVQVCNASELYAGWFSDRASTKVFGLNETIVAGAFNPHRKAEAVDGGYRISGQTGFNSGCHAATWIIGLADIYEGDELKLDADGIPTTILTLTPLKDMEIIENWNTMGMRGTGSDDVKATDLFVPMEMAVPFVPMESTENVYTKIATWATVGCHAAVSLGIAQSAIDDLTELGAKVPAYTENALSNRNIVQMRLALAEGKLNAARAFFYSTFEKLWENAHERGPLDIGMKAQCQLAGTHAVTTGAEVVDLVHACVGATGIRNEQRFQKYFRDAHVITQHAFVSESRLTAVGQILFGLEPDWPFFEF